MAALAVLRPGDWVRFDGGEHEVLAVAGTSVRLRSAAGSHSVVLASYLMAAPEFAVTGGEPVPEVEPFGLLDSLPEDVLAAAREWERHVVEVQVGLPPDAAPDAAPRPEYDPTTQNLAAREQAKATELRVSVRTIQSRRARYARQGLWGLVDQRAVRSWEATGRADVRLVAAIRAVLDAETHASTGTRSRLIRRMVKAVEATHGPGVVPLLRMSASRLPHARLLEVDARMEMAAAKPVIVPDTIVIDNGKVFVSDTFIRACARLGVSVQNCRPGTRAGKGIVEATCAAVNTLFCQHVAAYTGSSTQLRGDRVDAQAAWTVPDLQDLLDEWLLGWQQRPHDALRDPYFPRRAISLNDKYAALVAAAGTCRCP
jgi:hypothetical protein